MYKEIMTNDDNLESKIPTSSLLKMCCLVQVELCVYCPVGGDELTASVLHDLTLKLIYRREDNPLATTVYMEVQWNVH